jgi:hypothetical protein
MKIQDRWDVTSWWNVGNFRLLSWRWERIVTFAVKAVITVGERRGGRRKHQPTDFSIGCCTTQFPALFDSEPSAISLPTRTTALSWDVAPCYFLQETRWGMLEQRSCNERMLQRTQMLQRTRRNIIGRRSTRVRMTFRAFPLWLERQS